MKQINVMNAGENYLKELKEYNDINFYRKLARRGKIEIKIISIERLKPSGITR